MKVVNKKELHQVFLEVKENKQENLFNELYNKCGNLVYKIAFSIIKNKESSEDIKQIVFLKIWKMPQDSLPTNYEASWLYTLTKNETLNYIRKQTNEVSLDEIYYIANEEAEIDRLIDRESYNKIISRLEEKEQEIVSLKIIANLSFKEISLILKEPIGTVQWRYYKSMHALRTWLSNLIILITSILGLYVSRNTKGRPNLSESIEQNVNEIENSGNAGIDEDENNKKEDAISSPSPTEDEKVKNEITDTNTENKAETTQTNTVQETITYSYTQIGLISIATICFTITIIFSIILIKHQQNRRKKVSK